MDSLKNNPEREYLIVVPNPESPQYVIDLCNHYWNIDDEFRFVNHMDDLEEHFKLTKAYLHNTAFKHSRVEVICRRCNETFLTFTKRTKHAYSWIQQFHYGAPLMCEECQMQLTQDE